MDDTDKNKSETAVQEPPKNDATNQPTPQVVEKKTDDSEVERLRKEKEQVEMERNQLRNKLKEEEDAKAAAKAKELEEQNEFKTLYEQEKAKREEMERESEAENAKRKREEAQSNVLSDYSDDVKELAKDTGVELGDVTEEAVNEYKAKLDKIQTRLGNSQKVTPNNPGAVSGKKEYSREEMYEILNDPAKRDAYYRAKGGSTAMMMEPAKG